MCPGFVTRPTGFVLPAFRIPFSVEHVNIPFLNLLGSTLRQAGRRSFLAYKSGIMTLLLLQKDAAAIGHEDPTSINSLHGARSELGACLADESSAVS